MFPFRTPFAWYFRNRQHHLIAVAKGAMEGFTPTYRPIVEARIASLRRWLVVRITLFILLYFGLIASAMAVIFQQWPAADLIEDTVRKVARFLYGLTGVIAVALLLAMRTIGQLEADLIGCLTVGREPPHADPPRKKAKKTKKR